jgi:hypothetical protein
MRKMAVLLLTLALVNLCAGKAFTQSASGSLPVVLVSFSADLTSKQKVALLWTTQQQVVTDYFFVERSSDGLSWIAIASIQSTGVSAKPVSYNFIDNLPLKGLNFYRIRIKSLDGTAGYTVIKSVHVSTGSMNVYPNPATNQVTISLAEQPHADSWSLTVINNRGQLLLQKKYNNDITTISLPINSYPAGNYTLVITDGNTRQSNKLVINRN